MPFAVRLHQLRIQKRLSQYQLAERTGLKVTHVSLLEKGEAIPSGQMLDRFAEALDVPLYQLFYDQDPPQTPWLTPRPDLEELLEDQAGATSEAEAGFLKRVKVFCHELASLLH